MAAQAPVPCPPDDVMGDYDLSGVDDDLDAELAAAAELAAEGAEEEADANAAAASAAAVMAGAGKGNILGVGPDAAAWAIPTVSPDIQSVTTNQTPAVATAPASGAVPAVDPPRAAVAATTNGGVKDARESNGTNGGGGGNRKSSASRRVGKRQGSSSNKGGGRNSSGGRSEDGVTTNERDEHPWKVGSTLEVVSWTGIDRKFCDIVETAPVSSMANSPDPAKRTKYYVHYHGLNRRMDEWISADRVTKPPSVAKALAKAQREELERARREFERENSEVDLGIRTRRQKRKTGEGEEDEAGGAGGVGGMHGGMGGKPGLHMDDDHDEHHGLDEASLKEHEEVTKVKNVNGVELGRYRMECWYFSPFPKEYYPDGYVDTLYFCEYTLRYFRHKKELLRFQRTQNPPRHPPGNEIYRNGNLAMFEVDGGEQKEYGQNLCSLAKLFLDHKTLYYDVDPFLFYVMCEVDAYGFHPVGYFSKEKYSDLGYNLACILTFPSYQRKGYGRFLISFSYELSKKEEKVGSPEKPLSDLGAAAYRSYWASVIIQAMKSFNGRELAVVEISKVTSIVSDDVIDTMTRLGMLRYRDGEHHIVATPALLETLSHKYPVKEPRVDPNKVHWTPLVDSAHLRDKFFIRNKIPPRTDPIELEEE